VLFLIETVAGKVMMMPTRLNNRYQVIRVLSSGGFGETFLAEDTQMPSGRRCVIKQLKPVANNPQIYQVVQERFGAEAAILEELGDGCNQIPRLYAYFSDNGQFYLVQEYIEGQTLTQKVQQQGTLSESSVKEILTNILPVLDYVHSKRIVHRDIKPDNIILRFSDDKPVLIDFGAVKETMGTTVTASGNSTRSIVIGTPGFMPSEQTIGRPVFASDLYSLGLTAIYLLTGKIPQELATDPATGEVLWRQYAWSVTPSFAAVLDKVIQSHARDRYSSAREMLQALQIGASPMAPTVLSSSPTVLSSPPQQGGYVHQAPTVLSPAPVGVPYQQQVYYQQSPATAKRGMSDWLKAVIMGGVIGGCVVGGLWLTRGQQSTQTEAKPTPTVAASPTSSSETSNTGTSTNPGVSTSSETSNTGTSANPGVSSSSATSNTEISAQPQPWSDSPPPSYTSPTYTQPRYSSTSSSITRNGAVGVINQWLQAKRVMFAPPYNSQPAAELTTGKQYEKTAGVNGSINSLRQDGHSYRYGVQTIDSVDDFSANSTQAIIQVKVTEDRKLVDSNGNILPKETDFQTRTVRYRLQFVDDRWKIASSEILSN
jgi:serine/threonine protein kinase